MPTIEQVTKRLLADREWFTKCMIGGFLTIVPIANLLAFGYLYRLFKRGKLEKEFRLPDWNWSDWKGLGLDGLRFLVIGLIFVVAPMALFIGLANLLPFESFLAWVPFIPIAFFSGPLLGAGLYLYMVKEDFRDCFNLEALGLMLKGAALSYLVPTLAYIGFLGVCWVIPPIAFFFGGVLYFYLMGLAFRALETSRNGR